MVRSALLTALSTEAEIERRGDRQFCPSWEGQHIRTGPGSRYISLNDGKNCYHLATPIRPLVRQRMSPDKARRPAFGTVSPFSLHAGGHRCLVLSATWVSCTSMAKTRTILVWEYRRWEVDAASIVALRWRAAGSWPWWGPVPARCVSAQAYTAQFITRNFFCDGRRPTAVVLADFVWRFIPPVSSCDRGWSHCNGSSVAR